MKRGLTRIIQTQSGTRVARYGGLVALGQTAGEAYNSLMVSYHGVNHGNNAIGAQKNSQRVSTK